MLALKIYLLSHAILLAGSLASAVWRLRTGDGLDQFGVDVLYLLIAFIFAGGGAVLAAGALS